MNTRDGIATRLKMADALGFMVEKNGIDHINIGELCKQAGISRQTFYYHFDNILEVYSWALLYREKQMFKNSKSSPSPPDHVVALCESLKRYRSLTYAFLGSGYRSEITNQLSNYLQEVCFEYLWEALKDTSTEVEIKTLSIFHADGYLGLIYKWVDRDMADDISEIVSIFVGSIYKVINSPAYHMNVESLYRDSTLSK